MEPLGIGEWAVLHGLKAERYKGASCTILGSPIDGRLPVRIQFEDGSLKDAKIKADNMSFARHAASACCTQAGVNAALQKYSAARPWDVLFVTHIIEFAVGSRSSLQR